MAATFHPELTDDTTVHQHFLGLVAARTSQVTGNAKS
jgi:glutamine amidotransferase PdxT